MSTNFIKLATLTPLENQSIHSPSFIISLQRIANTLASTPGALKCQFRKSTASPQLLLLASWADEAAHDYCDIQGIAPKILKEMFARVKPNVVNFANLDVCLIDFEEKFLVMERFHVKDGRKQEFGEEVKRMGVVGEWYVVEDVPMVPQVMPTDERELEVMEWRGVVSEKRMKEKVPDIWVGVGEEGIGEESGLRERTKDLVNKYESGRWEKYLEGRKDAPIGGIDLS
ncbi:hypothetical protein IFR05_009202 [Cadophora sp. M221]|nr:hypothetical protein IFR05_009202 [Cadophora sp. M221]